MKFGSTLSEDLRQKYKRRSLRPRVGDSVKIVRGEYKGIEGKVTKVDGENGKLNVEGVTREKIKGGKTANVPIDSSKVVLTITIVDDKLRKKKLEAE
ncbi:MAG: 50S ribosomal protein L24 [Thaumarchaeota archaeon]|nr:50S ribosomal protein L24 [Nitrososphaerota archaeon]MBI3116378.1 50S ribosomal protein L24 [Nitrososphaerota archaeon]MCS4539540.1 50S ribosomal protein L24 [Nitrososphaerota archaeon]